MRSRLLVAIAVAVALIGSVPAQDFQPCTTVVMQHVHFGKAGEFLDFVNRHYAPLFEGLMNEGKVLAWGVSRPMMNIPGFPTHSIWFTTLSMAEMDDLIEAFEALDKKLIAEDPQIFEKVASIVKIEKQEDMVFRDIMFGAGKPPETGAKPYTWQYTIKAKPGRENEFVRTWSRLMKPIMDGLAENGLIHAWGLSIQEIRRTSDFSHSVWISVPDFAAYEKARRAYMEAMAAMPSEDYGALAELVEMDASRTYVFRELIFHLAPMPAPPAG